MSPESSAISAAVLTVSDSSFRGTRQDASGPAVSEALRQRGFAVAATAVVADEHEAIAREIIRLCGLAQLVVTTGGTGVAPRDVTPEATLSLCDRTLPGIAEHIRAMGARQTPHAVLSRAV